MRRIIYLLLLISFSIVLWGCPRVNSPRDPLYLELQKINKKLDSQEQNTNTKLTQIQSKISQLDSNLNSKQKGNADYSYTLNQIIDELNVLKQQLSDNAQRNNDLIDKITFLQQSIDKLQNSSISNQTNPKTTNLPSHVGAETVYQMALADYHKNNFSLAINGFQQFLSKYPTTKLAGNAQYWMGECYYSMKNYKTAINEFDKVIIKYPDNNKKISAILKKAFCWFSLKNFTEAKKTLSQVVKEYPNSREANLASQKLKQIR